MNNSSIADNLTWVQADIDDMWENINRSPSDPIAHWISIITFIFAMIGSISNLMTVVVLIHLSTHLSTFVYLTGLSLSDMITCISITMTHIANLIVQTPLETSTIRFFLNVEIIFGALAAGSRVLSYWISTAVTMDRWILICHPIYGKKYCTLNRARIATRTLFFLAFLYSIPLVFEFKIIVMPSFHQMIQLDSEFAIKDEPQPKNSMLVTKGYSDLAQRRIYRWAYMFFNVILVYTIPTITILIFSIQLIRALQRLKARTKHLRQKTNSKDSTHRRSKYSVTLMVITLVLTLLICRSPTMVLWVLWSFDLTVKIFFDSSSSSFVRRFHLLANLIAIINAATNFFPFCIFGQLFRAECLHLYCWRRPTNDQIIRHSRRAIKYDQSTPLTNIDIQQPMITKNGQYKTIVRKHSEVTSTPFQSSIADLSHCVNTPRRQS